MMWMFHDRTLGVICMSSDNDATRGFGPLVHGHLKVDFGDIDGLRKIFQGSLLFNCGKFLLTLYVNLHVDNLFWLRG
jgi:acetylornithine/succinyldiaminopimelate/putrescine aminotransferase